MLSEMSGPSRRPKPRVPFEPIEFDVLVEDEPKVAAYLLACMRPGWRRTQAEAMSAWLYGLGYRKPAQAYLTEWAVLVTTHCDPAFPHRGVDAGLDIPVYDPEVYAHLWAYDRAMAKRLLGMLSLEDYSVQSQFEAVRRQRAGERDANLGSVWESWGEYDDSENGEEVSA